MKDFMETYIGITENQKEIAELIDLTLKERGRRVDKPTVLNSTVIGNIANSIIMDDSQAVINKYGTMYIVYAQVANDYLNGLEESLNAEKIKSPVEVYAGLLKQTEKISEMKAEIDKLNVSTRDELIELINENREEITAIINAHVGDCSKDLVEDLEYGEIWNIADAIVTNDAFKTMKKHGCTTYSTYAHATELFLKGHQRVINGQLWCNKRGFWLDYARGWSVTGLQSFQSEEEIQSLPDAEMPQVTTDEDTL